MDTPTLLRELSTRGATVALEGEALRVQPSRVLTDELRAAIRCHKSELLQFLARENVSRKSAPPEYSQPRILSAWEVFREHVEGARRPDGLIQMDAEIVAAWRAAESEVGYTLTLRGERRGDPLPSTRAGELHREAIAEINAGPCARWSAADRRAVALAQAHELLAHEKPP